MTKQKFYEFVILKSYKSGLEYFENELAQMNCDIQHMSFSELLVRRAIVGLPDNIPAKHPFDKLGFKYIQQLLIFCKNEEDDELTEEYFKFLKQHKKYVDFSNTEQAEIFCSHYVDTVASHNRTFCEELGTYIFDNLDKITDADLRIKFLQLVRAFGKVTLATSLLDINEAVRKYYA